MVVGALLGSIQLLIMKASIAPAVVAGAISLFRWRQLPRTLRYLVALTALSLLTELVGRLLWWQHQSNLFLQPVYIAGEFGVLVLLYQQTLRSAAFSRVVPWLLGGFGIFTLATSLLTADLAQSSSVLRVVESVFILIILGLYFRTLLNELTVEHLEREPMFWVSLGLLLYFLGDVNIFLFSKFLFQNYSKEFNLTVWAIHAVLYMVLYCCIALALWLPPKK